jgi:hypothetical protein
MTVYELIQELVQYDANKEVVIDFTPRDFDVTVDSGLTEGDDMTIEMNECSGSDLSLSTLKFENHRRVHIEVEED